VEDLDRQVLARLAEDLLELLALDLAGPVVGVDDVVTELEVDELEFALRFEIVLEQGVFDCLRNDVLLGCDRRCARPLVCACKISPALLVLPDLSCLPSATPCSAL
jgi:hypothetical protein